ncbi:hypothetical protein J0B03_05645 [Alkalibacter rhizosphaerae]|uniref:EcsC family protein n=1 Tax=Alkalibacter rhizosphaerae TaxID=2815577 RepID=A0A974XH09_9FIRM|nr:hypothetical protein [Alkalibacter rhizosphaerae]QSX09546.1 hypothetical protein J0B03_05645 [Alkalibacter rhizosphaerae]
MSELVNQSNGNLFQDILKAAVQVPGVRISRTEFLRKSLSKHFQEDLVKLAIEANPARAGITTKELNRIAKSSIDFETNKVTAISAATGFPGGIAMMATIPADLTQYFAHVLRILQKLIYLYGWDDVFTKKDEIDDETMSLLTMFTGVMFGVEAANKLVYKLASNAAIRANKVIAAKPLTQGFIYPIVKRIALAITGRMNKALFAKGVSKAIPVIGAVASGGLTFITFKPLANRLKKHLETLPIADVNFYKKQAEAGSGKLDIDISDIIEGDFDIVETDDTSDSDE